MNSPVSRDQRIRSLAQRNIVGKKYGRIAVQLDMTSKKSSETLISYSRMAIMVCVALLAGCNSNDAKAPVAAAEPLDPWVLTATEIPKGTPMLLWNGLVGFRIGPDGKPVSSIRIHDYQATGEEKIGPSKPLAAFSSLKPDRATLDMRTGTTSIEHSGKTQQLHLAPGANTIAEGPGIADSNAPDIEIDGPVEDQQVVRSFLFYLRTAIDPKAGMSISPYGLSSTTYNGHIFWDADIWVFPALALLDPPKAKAILEYRQKLLSQARLKAAYVFTPPSGNGRNDVQYKFPWESSVTGKETAPGDSKKEEHISGDVAWAQHQGEALGLTNNSATIVDGVGAYYRARSRGVVSGAPAEMRDVMSPDENHIGDNDLYTNLIAQWCINGGKFEGPIKFKLPKDDKTFLTYDNDMGRGYKQAAAVLAIYPLQYPPAEAQAKAMMERFADKVTKNGPAMSESIHALIWARLGETDKAYKSWLNSWKPYVFPPFLQFSEKRSRPTTYFTTGAAGSLQTVLYGFLGIRIDSVQTPGSIWSKRLPTGDWLSIKPNLPSAWKSVKLKGFTLLGERYTLTATHTSATVTPYVPSSKEKP